MNKRYKYRFKTEAEFIAEFGNKWRTDNPIYWNESMDYLLGTNWDYDFGGWNHRDIPRLDGYHVWTISVAHIIKVKNPSPSYKPKKFIYE